MGNLSFAWHRLKKNMKKKPTRKKSVSKLSKNEANHALVAVHTIEQSEPLKTKEIEQNSFEAEVNRILDGEHLDEEKADDLLADQAVNDRSVVREKPKSEIEELTMMVSFKQSWMIEEEMHMFARRKYFVSCINRELGYLDIVNFCMRILKLEWRKDANATKLLIQRKLKTAQYHILENLKMPKPPSDYTDRRVNRGYSRDEVFAEFDLFRACSEFKLFAVKYICENYPKANQRNAFLRKNFGAGLPIVSELCYHKLEKEILGEYYILS
jgi:hypothetical protein